MTPAERTQRMLNSFAKKGGITRAQLLSDCRDKKIVAVRQKAMHFLWKQKGWTLTEIGRLFDRDHTTVRFACQKIERESK